MSCLFPAEGFADKGFQVPEDKKISGRLIRRLSRRENGVDPAKYAGRKRNLGLDYGVCF